MSVRRSLLIIALFLPVGFWFSGVIDRLFVQRQVVGASSLGSTVNARGRIVYVLNDDEWISFQTPLRHGAIRVITNANCLRRSERSAADEIEYSIEYRVLGRDQDLLDAGEYHFRTSVNRGRARGGDVEVFSGFYLDRNLVPADSRSLMLDLVGEEYEEAEVQIRASWHCDAVDEIVCRVYYEEYLEVTDRLVRWQRMTRENKERVAEIAVYSLNLIPREDRKNFSSKEWTAIAPLGVKGEDYLSRRMYRMNRFDDDDVTDVVKPSGVLVDRHVRGTFRVPEDGGRVRLLVEPARGKVPGRPVALQVRWFGRGSWEVHSRAVELEPEGGEIDQWFDEGGIEVESAHEVAVRAFVERGGEWFEFTPERRFARVFEPVDDPPLEYRVFHGEYAQVPLRLDLRVVAEADKDDQVLEAAIEVERLDDDGGVIAVDPVVVRTSPSQHDRLHATETSGLVSDAQSVFMELGREVKSLRVRPVEGRALVRASSALPNDERILQIRLRRSGAAERRESSRSWFPLRPIHRRELVLGGRAHLVSLQDRVRGIHSRNPESSGGYQSRAPEGEWVGRSLLEPVDPEAPIGRFPGLRFSELEDDVEYLGQIFSGGQSELVSPTLVHERLDDAQGELLVEVIVDGRLHQQFESDGLRGEINLLPIPPGERRVRIRGDKLCRFFLGRFACEGSSVHRKRSVERLGEQPLEYRFTKDETSGDRLVGALFFESGVEAISDICVTIEGPESRVDSSTRSPTTRRRRFEVSSAATREILVLGSEEPAFRRGPNILIPLGDDLPFGEYRVRFTIASGSPVFVALREGGRRSEDVTRIRVEPDLRGT